MQDCEAKIMATVTYVKVKKQSPAAMYGVINYCKREDKVRDIQSGRRIVSGINCNGENAFREFMTTKGAYDKLDGTYYYHYVQSFSYKEGITHDKAHEIAREFAAEAWPGHEILVATHLDTKNPHSHFVINSVSFENGYKLRQDTHTLEHLREKSDRICMSHGYSIIKNPQNRTSYIPRGEYRAAQRGTSWKFALMWNIDQAMKKSGSRKDFVQEMKRRGYDMIWTDTRKSITFICPNGMKCRDFKLHEQKYLKGKIENEFKLREQLSKHITNGTIEKTEWSGNEEIGRDTISTDTVRNTQRDEIGRTETPTGSSDISTNTVQDDRWTLYEPRPGEIRKESDLDSEERDGRYADPGIGTEPTTDRESVGDNTTGWEKERGIYFGDIPDDDYGDSGLLENDEREDIGTGRFERRAGESHDENYHYGGTDFGGIVGTALHGAAALADMIDSGSDDEEERKKEQEAKMAGGNLGALVGLGAGIISALVQKDEPDEELIREQEEIDEMLEDEIEDEEYIDFMMGM